MISINPGGSEFEAPSWSIENGCAYEIESWNNCQPGQALLQQQVRRMLEIVEIEPEKVLSGYLVPFRSPSWKALDRKREALEFGCKLWRKIFELSQFNLILVFGKDVGPHISELLGARLEATFAAGWGKQTIDRYRFGPAKVLLVLPHLSRFQLFGHAISEGAFCAALRQASANERLPLTKFEHVRHTDSQLIRLVVRNPKIGKSHYRFACYRDGLTVKQYKDAVLAKLGADEAKKCAGDLACDTASNFIRLEWPSK